MKQNIEDKDIIEILKSRPDLLSSAIKETNNFTLRNIIGSPAPLLPYMQPVPSIRPEFAKLDVGGYGLQVLIDRWDFLTVADIGSGEGAHAKILEQHGKEVTTVDMGKSKYFQKSDSSSAHSIIGNFMEIDTSKQFDCVWASHILEHQPNVQIFIKKLCDWVRPNGILAITVPPLKYQVVGGHLSLWTPGHLLYNLVLSGLNCRYAHVMFYHYNITAILRKEVIELPDLSFDYGDVELLREWLPSGFYEGIDGHSPDILTKF